MTYGGLASSPHPRILPGVGWTSSLHSQGKFSYHLWATNPQTAKHLRGDARPREGKVTGVFVWEERRPSTLRSTLSLTEGAIKALRQPLSSYTSAIMNPLLILAFVGAAGEFHV